MNSLGDGAACNRCTAMKSQKMVAPIMGSVNMAKKHYLWVSTSAQGSPGFRNELCPLILCHSLPSSPEFASFQISYDAQSRLEGNAVFIFPQLDEPTKQYHYC